MLPQLEGGGILCSLQGGTFLTQTAFQSRRSIDPNAQIDIKKWF